MPGAGRKPAIFTIRYKWCFQKKIRNFNYWKNKIQLQIIMYKRIRLLNKLEQITQLKKMLVKNSAAKAAKEKAEAERLAKEKAEADRAAREKTTNNTSNVK